MKMVIINNSIINNITNHNHTLINPHTPPTHPTSPISTPHAAQGLSYPHHISNNIQMGVKMVMVVGAVMVIIIPIHNNNNKTLRHGYQPNPNPTKPNPNAYPNP